MVLWAWLAAGALLGCAGDPESPGSHPISGPLDDGRGSPRYLWWKSTGLRTRAFLHERGLYLPSLYRIEQIRDPDLKRAAIRYYEAALPLLEAFRSFARTGDSDETRFDYLAEEILRSTDDLTMFAPACAGACAPVEQTCFARGLPRFTCRFSLGMCILECT